MTDQLVSLETAILAKEKGYNQNPYKTDNAYGPEYTDGSSIKLRSSSLFNPDSNTAVAPTQSLLQKWIREIHIIVVTVYANASGYCYELHYSPVRGGTHIKDSEFTGPNDSGCWNTYEEALEVALYEALKLIT